MLRMPKTYIIQLPYQISWEVNTIYFKHTVTVISIRLKTAIFIIK